MIKMTHLATLKQSGCLLLILETAYFTSKPILLTKNIEKKVRSKVRF